MKTIFPSIALPDKSQLPKSLQDFLLILLGTALQAWALRLCLIPALLVSGGVSGLSQLVNHYTGWPIGLMVFLGNLPLFILGWRFLGGPRFAVRTVFAVTSFSIILELPLPLLPAAGITDDLILNALYGGIVSGLGFGLVYRGKGTSGGTDILARILNHWHSIPVSQSYLMTDAVIILTAGLAFGWENALYALVMLYVSGITAETVSQGPNKVQTAMIISSKPEPIKEKIFQDLGRGVTMIDVRGGYTDQPKTLLYCVISRSEVAQLKTITREADPQAFLVIGKAHEVRGEGFLDINEET